MSDSANLHRPHNRPPCSQTDAQTAARVGNLDIRRQGVIRRQKSRVGATIEVRVEEFFQRPEPYCGRKGWMRKERNQ